MKLSRWVPIGVTMVIGAAATVNSFWAFKTSQNIYEQRRKSAVDRVAAQFRASTQAIGSHAAALATAIATTPAVEAAFRGEDRKKLAELVKPTFKALNERFHVEGIQFTDLSAHVFLRSHAPEKFGDSAAKREMITTTLQRKIAQFGIETGSSGVKVRGILPIGPKGQEIGLVEVAMPFETVVDGVADMTGFQVGVYIISKLAGDVPGRTVGTFKEVAASNTDLMKTLVGESDIDLVQDVVSREDKIDGKLYGIVRIPVLDFANQNIGTLVAARSFESIQKQESKTLLQTLVQIALMTIIGAGVVSFVFAGLIMRPLAALKKELHASDEAAASADLVALQERDDEIGEIARKIGRHAA